MHEYKRRSPVKFNVQPAETEIRGGWEVVLEYSGEGEGPFLVDLSHCARWDLQSGTIDEFKPWGRDIPKEISRSVLSGGLLINRMNRTQASIWNLCGEDLTPPDEFNYTDITDGQCLLAIIGKNALAIMEKLSSLDLAKPGMELPRLFQGPVLHIPCQAAVLNTDDHPAVFISFSRGYGEAMADAILDSASEMGLRPGGERIVSRLLDDLSK